MTKANCQNDKYLGSSSVNRGKLDDKNSRNIKSLSFKVKTSYIVS